MTRRWPTCALARSPVPSLAALAAHPVKVFADTPAWQAHLTALGFDARAVTPDPVQIATEGALWGAIRHHGLMPDTVVVSDGAGQFRVGLHALCWVHAERLVHTLIPTTAAQRKAIALTRTLIWWFYADLKAWARAPCPKRARALRVLCGWLPHCKRRIELLTRWSGAVLCPAC